MLQILDYSTLLQLPNPGVLVNVEVIVNVLGYHCDYLGLITELPGEAQPWIKLEGHSKIDAIKEEIDTCVTQKLSLDTHVLILGNDHLVWLVDQTRGSF